MSKENLNKEQDKQVGKWGGPRANSERPKGSYKRPQIRDYLNEKDIKKFVKIAQDHANASYCQIWYMRKKLGGFPADSSLVYSVDELHAVDNVGELLETA